MAGHESARTTGFYDRRNDQIALDEVERIVYKGEIIRVARHVCLLNTFEVQATERVEVT